MGTTIIDSIHPFTVPHIIISSPPPQDPRIPWSNATNDPQDAGHGRFLTVPSSRSVYINCPDDDDDSSGFAASPVSPHDFIDSLDDLSEADSTPPCTPFAGDGDTARFWETSDVVAVTDCHQDCGGALRVISQKASSQPTCDATNPFFVDEDEDDLPPFDDWYTSVLTRTQLIA